MYSTKLLKRHAYLLYHECVIINLVINHIYYHYFILCIVGVDYTTLTGEETITAVLAEGSNTAYVEILIHHDIESEGNESFTAELKSDSQISSATVFIQDIFTVLCQFNKSAYNVYESVRAVVLNIDCSSRDTFGQSSYTMKVDTIYGMGNASGELIYNI